MKKYSSSLLLAIFALAGTSLAPAQQPAAAAGTDTGTVTPPPAPRQRASPHETLTAYAGGDRRSGSMIVLTYGRPFSARGGKGEARKIWGGIVEWNKAYRLGADEATTILTQHPIEIGGATIPAGVHALYMVPSESGPSKLAFSRNVVKWGIPVDESKDVARVDLKQDTLSTPVDQLTLAIDSNATGGVLRILWEKTQYSVPFTVKK